MARNQRSSYNNSKMSSTQTNVKKGNNNDRRRQRQMSSFGGSSGSRSSSSSSSPTPLVEVRFLSGSSLGLKLRQVNSNVVIEGFEPNGPGCGKGILDIGYILKKINGERVMPLSHDDEGEGFQAVLERLDRTLGSDHETLLTFRPVSKFTSILATARLVELRLHLERGQSLGIRFSALTVVMAQDGRGHCKTRVVIFVEVVEKGSAAAQSETHLEKGDILVTINKAMVINKPMATITKLLEGRSNLQLTFKRGALPRLSELNHRRMRGVMNLKAHCSLIIIGDSGVGKTRLLHTFARNTEKGDDDDWMGGTTTTIGVEAMSCDYVLPSGREAQIQVWDTAGQERYHAITRAHFRRGDGVLLVYDITSYSSFRSVERWLREYRETLASSPSSRRRKERGRERGKEEEGEEEDTHPVILIGNKTDLDRTRAVTEKEARAFAAAQNPPLVYAETTAMAREGVVEAFGTLITAVFQRRGRTSQGGGGTEKTSSSSSGRNRSPFYLGMAAVDLRKAVSANLNNQIDRRRSSCCS